MHFQMSRLHSNSLSKCYELWKRVEHLRLITPSSKSNESRSPPEGGMVYPPRSHSQVCQTTWVCVPARRRTSRRKIDSATGTSPPPPSFTFEFAASEEANEYVQSTTTEFARFKSTTTASEGLDEWGGGRKKARVGVGKLWIRECKGYTLWRIFREIVNEMTQCRGKECDGSVLCASFQPLHPLETLLGIICINGVVALLCSWRSWVANFEGLDWLI